MQPQANRPTAAVIGMGITGCSAVRYLQRQGYNCTAFDERMKKLPEGVEAPLVSGTLDVELLAGFDRVVVSPGIAWSTPAIRQLVARGVRVHGDLELFAESYRGELLVVTGTNGKTTTVTLIGTLLGVLPGGIEVGGNIGVPMLDLIDRASEEQPGRTLLELSSFQLERDSKVHPNWAVLLNIQPDHADMHASPEEYLAAKLRIFAQQQAGDTALLPLGGEWDGYAAELAGRGVRMLRFGHCDSPEEAAAGLCMVDDAEQLFWTQNEEKKFIDCRELPIRGAHQRINLAVAAQAAADFGVSQSVIRQALVVFRGLAHRLQTVASSAGREWIDDSKATNPDAAIAALGAFDRVLWICGGLRKGLDLAPMVPSVRRRVAHAYVIGKEPEPYVEMLREAGVPYTVTGELAKAVKLAARNPMPLPVLLAPAAASQDQFANYGERGRAFAKAAKELGE